MALHSEPTKLGLVSTLLLGPARLPRSRKINSLRDHETTEACDREADFIFCRANERFVGGGVRAAVQRKGEEC